MLIDMNIRPVLISLFNADLNIIPVLICMSNADINIANGLGLIYIFNPKMNSRFGLTLYVYRRQTVDAIRCTSITATVDIV